MVPNYLNFFPTCGLQQRCDWLMYEAANQPAEPLLCTTSINLKHIGGDLIHLNLLKKNFFHMQLYPDYTEIQ